MDPAATPAGSQASCEKLLAALRRLAPEQDAVQDMVAELMPRLVHATAAGGGAPYKAFGVYTTWKTSTLEGAFPTAMALADAESGEVFATKVQLSGKLPSADSTGSVPEHWALLALLCWVYQRCRAAGGAVPLLLGPGGAAMGICLAQAAARLGCLLPPSWACVEVEEVAPKDESPATRDLGERLTAAANHLLPKGWDEHAPKGSRGPEQAVWFAQLALTVAAYALLQCAAPHANQVAMFLAREGRGRRVQQAAVDGLFDAQAQQLLPVTQRMALVEAHDGTADTRRGRAGAAAYVPGGLADAAAQALAAAAALQPSDHGADWGSAALARTTSTHAQQVEAMQADLGQQPAAAPAARKATRRTRSKKAEQPEQQPEQPEEVAEAEQAVAAAEAPVKRRATGRTRAKKATEA